MSSCVLAINTLSRPSSKSFQRYTEKTTTICAQYLLNMSMKPSALILAKGGLKIGIIAILIRIAPVTQVM